MPLFDFKCKSCGKTTEVLVRNNEIPECECGGTLERVREIEDCSFSQSSLTKFTYGLPGRPFDGS